MSMPRMNVLSRASYKCDPASHPFTQFDSDTVLITTNTHSIYH